MVGALQVDLYLPEYGPDAIAFIVRRCFRGCCPSALAAAEKPFEAKAQVSEQQHEGADGDPDDPVGY